MSNNEIYFPLFYEITCTVLKIFSVRSFELQLGITLKNEVLFFSRFTPVPISRLLGYPNISKEVEWLF